MMRLKDIDYKILFELMKNSRISDRQLAKKIGVSQPTVTRRRIMLEKKRLVEYTAIPNLRSLGFEILAFSFSKWSSKALTKLLPTEEFEKQVKAFFSAHPNVIFASTGGTGLGGIDSVSISIHKDYADYIKWVTEIKRVWGEYVDRFESLVLCLESNDIVRQITFKNLAEYMKKIEGIS